MKDKRNKRQQNHPGLLFGRLKSYYELMVITEIHHSYAMCYHLSIHPSIFGSVPSVAVEASLGHQVIVEDKTLKIRIVSRDPLSCGS